MTLDLAAGLEGLVHFVKAVLLQRDRSCPVPIDHVLLMRDALVFLLPLFFTKTCELAHLHIIPALALFSGSRLRLLSQSYSALMIWDLLQEMSLGAQEVERVRGLILAGLNLLALTVGAHIGQNASTFISFSLNKGLIILFFIPN